MELEKIKIKTWIKHNQADFLYPNMPDIEFIDLYSENRKEFHIIGEMGNSTIWLTAEEIAKDYELASQEEINIYANAHSISNP